MSEIDRKWLLPERRKLVRAPCRYSLNFRSVSEGTEARWDVSTIINLNKIGILFYSSRQFSKGTILEFRIHTPYETGTKICRGIVMRCEPMRTRSGIFNIVVDIAMFDSQAKEVLYQVINEYIKNSGLGSLDERR